MFKLGKAGRPGHPVVGHVDMVVSRPRQGHVTMEDVTVEHRQPSTAGLVM